MESAYETLKTWTFSLAGGIMSMNIDDDKIITPFKSCIKSLRLKILKFSINIFFLQETGSNDYISLRGNQ